MTKYKCKNCNDVIESQHTHDFVSCSCFKETKRLVDEIATKVVEYIKDKKIDESGPFNLHHYVSCAVNDIMIHGFFVDGGHDYCRYGGNINDMEKVD